MPRSRCKKIRMTSPVGTPKRVCGPLAVAELLAPQADVFLLLARVEPGWARR